MADIGVAVSVDGSLCVSAIGVVFSVLNDLGDPRDSGTADTGVGSVEAVIVE